MKAEADVGGHVLEIYGTVNQRFHVNELFTQFSPVVSLHVLQTSFYDTIRDAILTCARKPT